MDFADFLDGILRLCGIFFLINLTLGRWIARLPVSRKAMRRAEEERQAALAYRAALVENLAYFESLLAADGLTDEQRQEIPRVRTLLTIALDKSA